MGKADLVEEAATSRGWPDFDVWNPSPGGDLEPLEVFVGGGENQRSVEIKNNLFAT